MKNFSNLSIETLSFIEQNSHTRHDQGQNLLKKKKNDTSKLLNKYRFFFW